MHVSIALVDDAANDSHEGRPDIPGLPGPQLSPVVLPSR